MNINFVISDLSLTDWQWRIVDSEGVTIATSEKKFKTRYECIADAEAIQGAISNACFYDFAGIPINEMHLSKGTLHCGKKPIKISR